MTEAKKYTCKFTEFEARCKRCRFYSKHCNYPAGVAIHRCVLNHGLQGETDVFDAWVKYKRDWCPEFDEPPPSPPGLLRRIGKAWGLC